MTLDDVLTQIETEGRSWVVWDDGKIRQVWSEEVGLVVCPLSSLGRRATGRLLPSAEWQEAARSLDLDPDAAHDLVQAADYTAFHLRGYHYADRVLDLRRRLLAACHLPPEKEPTP